jgi:hypothetical protein
MGCQGRSVCGGVQCACLARKQSCSQTENCCGCDGTCCANIVMHCICDQSKTRATFRFPATQCGTCKMWCHHCPGAKVGQIPASGTFTCLECESVQMVGDALQAGKVKSCDFFGWVAGYSWLWLVVAMRDGNRGRLIHGHTFARSSLLSAPRRHGSKRHLRHQQHL